jgi:ornithine carbamoyltransferase
VSVSSRRAGIVSTSGGFPLAFIPMSDGPRHVLRPADLSRAELNGVLELAAQVKADPGALAAEGSHQTLVAIFELPSTRTRLAFAAAAQRLGMTVTAVAAAETQLARGEALVATARTLSALSAAIVVRTASHELLEELASTTTVPVMNALSPRHHPCEALVSLFTLRERFGGLAGLRLSFVGVGNNVAHSLLEAGTAAGMEVRIACPPRQGPRDDIVAGARALATATGASISVLDDPREAVSGADVVYTDVWSSMDEKSTIDTQALAAFRVDGQLMALAAGHAVFLHCLPARRGLEVTADGRDGPSSLVWQQVANQIPVTQALVHSVLSVGET